MPFPNQFWEVLQEESHDQQSNMHAINISIGGNDYIVVA